MRNLATVQIIKSVDPIPGKDRIGYISFQKVEWRVIGEKSLKSGDKVIYIEYDSILPVNPAFEFLRKRCFSEKYQGFKIGCMKMAGLVSYGLVLPYESVKGIIGPGDWEKLAEEADLTDILQVRKAEDDPPAPPRVKKNWFQKLYWNLFGKKEKLPEGFVPLVPRTDETRAEVLPYLFEERWQGLPVYTTVKVDGQSVTYAIFKGKFYVASRNAILYVEKLQKAKRDFKPGRRNHWKVYGSVFFEMACKYDIPAKMVKYLDTDYAIQCEQAGPGIQKNKMGLEDNELFLFNLFNIHDQGYYQWEGLCAFSQAVDIPTVPFIEKTEFRWKTMDELYAYSKGTYGNGKFREGVVIRSAQTADNPYILNAEKDMHAMWSFKVINPDYLV
jgi:RNA ligase (TIGR02306 family)